MGNRNPKLNSPGGCQKSKQDPSPRLKDNSARGDRHTAADTVQSAMAAGYGPLVACALLLWSIQLAYLMMAPFSKVEESFNMQAIHDMLFHGISDTSQYDHHAFPGVVPRTFLGALSVAGIASPMLWTIRDVLGITSPLAQKLIMLYTARAILGLLVTLAHLAMSVTLYHRTASLATGMLYLLLTASQFHTTFWATRSLPNTFALIPTTFALAAALSRRGQPTLPRITTTLFALAGIVFRSELILLAAPLYLLALVRGRLHLTRRFLVRTLAAVLGSVLLTVAVDSYFWHQPWMWPEWHVLLFNTLHNQSHLWGTQPWYAYAAWHVPKLVMGGLPWILVGVCTGHGTRDWAAVATAFIGLYSLLPHKETRFIIYAVPLLNACAAVGLAWAWSRGGSHTAVRGCRLLVVATIAGSLAASATMALVSSYNYPGGDALLYLATSDSPQLASVKTRVVHVDVYTAQTGASRFVQESGTWVYNKSETLELKDRRDKSNVGVRVVRWEDWQLEQRDENGPNEVRCFRCLARVDPVGMGKRLVGGWGAKRRDAVLVDDVQDSAVWGLVRLKPCVCVIVN